MKQQGIIKLIIIIIVAIAILSYFRFDLRSFVESEPVQRNFAYVWGFVVKVWDNYLEAPAQFIWQRIVVDLVWNNFYQFIDRLSGNLTPIQ